MITLEDTHGTPQCGLDVNVKYFKNMDKFETYLNKHPAVYHRILNGYADFYVSTQEEEDSMGIKNLVICDWQTKGNVVRFWCCDQDKYDDIWGDDWNDAPYEHNAGRVYEEYVDKVIDIYFDFDTVILEAENDWIYNGNSPFSKQDFKEGKAPIFVVYWPHENDHWEGNEYHLLIGAKNTNRIFKFYMGDMIKPVFIDNKKIVYHIVHE